MSIFNQKEDGNYHTWIECQCTSKDHAVRISIYDWNKHGDIDLVIEPQLHYCFLPWYKRIWHALKLIFNQPIDSLYVDTMISFDEIQKIEKVFDLYRDLAFERGFR